MKLIVDMNLSPRWVGLLTGAGMQAVHWSMIGRRNAPDSEIMAYATTNDYVVLLLYARLSMRESIERMNPRATRGR